MSEARSKRSRTQIDYSKFGQGADDDDDFADSTPPPGKKPKKSAPPKTNTLHTALEKQATKKLQRKPVSERSFDRELELALALSRQEAGIATDDGTTLAASSSQDSDVGPGGESIVVTAEIAGQVSVADKPSEKEQKKASRKTPKLQSNKTDDPDFFEILGQDEVVMEEKVGSGRRRRQAAAKAAKYWSPSEDEEEDEERHQNIVSNHKANTGEDSDFKDTQPASWDSPSESEDSWAGSDDDSDFDGGKSKKSKKKSAEPPKKSSAKNKATNKKKSCEDSVYVDGIQISQPFAKSTSTPKPKSVAPAKKTAIKPMKPVQKENTVLPSLSKPAVKSPLLSSTGAKKSLGTGISKTSSPLVPSDTSRRSLGGCSTIRSPNGGGGGGGLRLGLSKKARIKPLHTSVNVPH